MKKIKLLFGFVIFLFIALATGHQNVEASTYSLDVNITSTEGSVYVYNNTTSTELTSFPATVADGDSITIQAWSKVGFEFYRFHYTFVDGPPDWYITSNPKTWSMSYDTTVNVQFNAVDTYSLALDINSLQGSVTVQNITTGAYITSFPATINENHEVKFTASPATGYEFKQYKIDFGSTTLYTSENPFTYTMDKDTTFTVQFDEIVTKTIDVSINSSHGSVTVYNETELEWITSFPATVNYNDSITFTATPATGYEFDKYVMLPEGGSSIDITSNPFTFTVQNNTTFNVLFTEIPTTTFEIQIPSAVHGSVTVYNETELEWITTFPTTVNTGDEITFTATPATGYEFDSYDMTPDGGSTINITTNPFTWTAQTDSQFTPYFTEIPTTTFDIVIDPLKGSVTVYNETELEWITSFPATVNRSDEITFNTTPATGYEFDKYAMLPDGGSTVNITTNPFTWTALDDTTFTVHLLQTFQITHTYSPFGETTMINALTLEVYETYPITIKEGSILKMTAEANPFYVFSHWVIDPATSTEYITMDNPYYLTDISDDIDITPHYAYGNLLTVNYDSLLSNLTITNIDTDVDYTLDFPLSIIPGTLIRIKLDSIDEEYFFSHWTVQPDGESSYTITPNYVLYTMPDTDVTYTAHYSHMYSPAINPLAPESAFLGSFHTVLGVFGMDTTAGYIFISMIILIAINITMFFTSISGMGYVLVNIIIIGLLTYGAFIPAWVIISLSIVLIFGFISLKGRMTA